MHPALEIDEILRNSFQFLITGPRLPQRRSLANLAVTCRAFLRPALEVLWFHLPSLSPLVMCLPEDSWEQRPGVNERPTLFLRRPLATTDWERLELYAPFVKSCSPYAHPSSFSTWADIDEGVSRALKIYKGSTPLLPNLRVLTWNPRGDTETNLDLFLTTNLSEFSTHSLQVNPDVLASFKQRCERLRKLDISLYLDEELDSRILSDLIVHLLHLENIHTCGPLTDDAIAHLSMLPNLQTVHIPNDAADFSRALSKNAPHHFFPSLLELTIYAEDLTSIASLLALCRPMNLQHLDIHVPYRSQVHAAPVERLFVELASSCSHDVLEGIKLRLAFGLQETHPRVPARILRHLFVFRRLRDLYLDVPFDLDDGVVEDMAGDMAASWPRLQQVDPSSCHARRIPGFASQPLS